MAIINNAAPAQQPAPVQSSDNGMGFLVGIVLLIVVVFVFIFYGVPLMKGAATGGTGNGGGTQINVPEKVDVNINKK